MKHLKYTSLFFLFLFSAAQSSNAQTFSLKGKIVDSISGSPLAKATVYINNSTKGTVSDENGNYILTGITKGSYELIISYVGYKPILKNIRITASGYISDFKLQVEEKQLREVLIISNSTRNQYLDLFKKNVLGFTFDAGKCIIRNTDVIQFVQGVHQNDIQAVADEELEIYNPVLGYTIYFRITDVFFNTKSKESHFYGYTRFVDLMNKDAVNLKWLRNRRNVYLGSSQHFFRSLVRKELYKEGFIISVDENDILTQRERNMNVTSDGSSSTVTQMNFSSAAMIRSLKEDSILTEYNQDGYIIYELNLEKRLYIKYRRNSDLKLQIIRALHLKTEEEIGTLTALRLRTVPVLLDYKGVVLTLANLYFDGIWAYERMANMLPEDYEPGK